MRKIYCDATGQEIVGPFVQTHSVTVQDPENGRHKFLNYEKHMRFKDLPTFVDYIYEQYEKAAWIPNAPRTARVDDGLVIKLTD